LENEDLIQHLKEQVLLKGGGHKVQEELLWSCLARQLAQQYESLNPHISKTLKQTNGNYFIKELYIRFSQVYEQTMNLRKTVVSLGGIETVIANDDWKSVCDKLQFQMVDAIWLVKQCCKYIFKDFGLDFV
jgi:hypothetical protein